MIQSKKSKSKMNNDSKNIKSVFIKIGVGAVITILMFILIIALLSFYILKKPIDCSYYNWITYISIILSSLVGGFAAARSFGKNGMLLGTLSSFPLIIILAVIVVALSSAQISYRLFLSMILSLISSALGGIAAVNLKRIRK